MPPINFYDYLSVTKPYILFALKILLKFVTKNYEHLLCARHLARSLPQMRGLEMIHSTDQPDHKEAEFLLP